MNGIAAQKALEVGGISEANGFQRLFPPWPGSPPFQNEQVSGRPHSGGPERHTETAHPVFPPACAFPEQTRQG